MIVIARRSAPSCFGNVNVQSLPFFKLIYGISHPRWVRKPRIKVWNRVCWLKSCDVIKSFRRMSFFTQLLFQIWTLNLRFLCRFVLKKGNIWGDMCEELFFRIMRTPTHGWSGRDFIGGEGDEQNLVMRWNGSVLAWSVHTLSQNLTRSCYVGSLGDKVRGEKKSSMLDIRTSKKM